MNPPPNEPTPLTTATVLAILAVITVMVYTFIVNISELSWLLEG